MTNRAHVRTCCLALGSWIVMLSVASAAELKFEWRPGMRCTIEQTLIADDMRIGTQTSRIDLVVTAAAEGLAIRFSNYSTTGMSVNDTPANRRQADAMGLAAVEREFFVGRNGGFVRAEPVEHVRQRLEKVQAGDARAAIAVTLMSLGDQQQLDDDYREDWQSLAGGWVGLTIEPGETRAMAPQSRRTATVTVGQVHECGGGSTARCVTLLAVTTPDSLGSSTRTELELEPETMIPHRWAEEDRLKDTETENPKPAEERTILQRKRSFVCKP